MASVERLKDGSYMALFHDDGRFLRGEGKKAKFRVYKTISHDGGRTWGQPEVIAEHPDAHLCEPGLIRSPDGKQIAVLLRENRRKHNSFVIFSDDEGKTWTEPRELPGSLTGDRHVGKYAPDGRLFVSFRDTTHESPTKGDWVGWVGTYDDIVAGREGQYRVRLMDNTKADRLRLPRRGGAARRHVRRHHLRALGRGRGAVHRQRAVHAGGTRRPGEGRTEGGGQGRHRPRPPEPQPSPWRTPTDSAGHWPRRCRGRPSASHPAPTGAGSRPEGCGASPAGRSSWRRPTPDGPPSSRAATRACTCPTPPTSSCTTWS